MNRFEKYLEMIKITPELTRRQKMLSTNQINQELKILTNKSSLWNTEALGFNKPLVYSEIIKKSNTVDLSPNSLDSIIEKIKKEIIDVANSNIEVLQKLKKRSIKASNIKETHINIEDFEKEYNALIPEIENTIKTYTSRISSDSEVTQIKHNFRGPLNSKGSFSIYIALKTNLPKLGITKYSTKSELKKDIDKKILEKIEKDSTFGTIGKEVVAELNTNKNISHNIRFVKVEKGDITPYISDKSTLVLSEVSYSLNLFFSLGSKK